MSMTYVDGVSTLSIIQSDNVNVIDLQSIFDYDYRISRRVLLYSINPNRPVSWIWAYKMVIFWYGINVLWLLAMIDCFLFAFPSEIISNHCSTTFYIFFYFFFSMRRDQFLYNNWTKVWVLGSIPNHNFFLHCIRFDEGKRNTFYSQYSLTFHSSHRQPKEQIISIFKSLMKKSWSQKLL